MTDLFGNQPDLTGYICGTMRSTVGQLKAMDVAKMAAKYGIREDWARYYRDQAIKGK
jgi:hypothetical protein